MLRLATSVGHCNSNKDPITLSGLSDNVLLTVLDMQLAVDGAGSNGHPHYKKTEAHLIGFTGAFGEQVVWTQSACTPSNGLLA